MQPHTRWGAAVNRWVWGLRGTIFLLLLLWPSYSATGGAAPASLIFPEPREVEVRSERFLLGPSIPILVPQTASPGDLALARLLTAELSDKYGLACKTLRAAAPPAGGPFILMGTVGNPLVHQYLESRGTKAAVQTPEGYLLEVDSHTLVIAGADDAGAFYGLQSVRQLIQGTAAHRFVPGVRVRDWPAKPFRGIKLYLPGHQNIPYFQRFVRDFLALYKYNRVIMELNGAMRLDRHPEVNAGWLELHRDLNATRRDRAPGPGGQYQDSANADTADGEVLEKSEVAALVAWARENHVEVIPEIPSLTHSYYLLTRHRELAEIPEAEWPDTYCPSNPLVYDLLFDVLDEYIDVIKPGMVHIGHDEWRIPWGVCPLCRGKDPRELYAQDINRIHDHLAQRGIKMSIYGDHLIEPLRGMRLKKERTPQGQPYETPGGLSPEQVRKLIPKDILVYNWFWADGPGAGEEGGGGEQGEGEANEVALDGWGFQQIYNNMEPNIHEYDRRALRRSVVGGAPSSWAATNEFNFGKDLMFEFLGCAQLLWSGHEPAQDELSETIQRLLPRVRRNLSAIPFPSDYDPVNPLPIEAVLGATSVPIVNLQVMKSGRVEAGNLVFELGSRQGKPAVALVPAGTESPAISVEEDVSSIVFLQAATEPARNITAYDYTWNYADTADLLGWYEVKYEDGYVETVPLRYGVNILEVGWGKTHAPGNLAYEAELVDSGGAGQERLTFFAYEWINPRRGIRV